jgi:hypothetical protein
MLGANRTSLPHDLSALAIFDLKPICTAKPHEAKESFAHGFDLQARNTHTVCSPTYDLGNPTSPSSVSIRIGKVTTKLNPEVMCALRFIRDQADTAFIPVLEGQNLNRISSRKLPSIVRRSRLTKKDDCTDSQGKETKHRQAPTTWASVVGRWCRNSWL